MEQTLSESEYYQMCFLPKEFTLKLAWKDKFLSTEVFKNTVKVFADSAKKLSPQSLFVDARYNKYTMSPEVQEWHDNTIIPIYRQIGVTGMAFIIPQSIFSELTHKKLFEKQNPAESFPIQFFKEEKEAIAWLEEHRK